MNAKNTSKVYRIQRITDGSGPYFGTHHVGSALDYSPSSHPEPGDDGIPWNKIKSNMACGFGSIESMVDWFDAKNANFLHEVGFEVAVYSVPSKKILVGDHQVMCVLPEVPDERISIREIGCWNFSK